MFSSGEKKFIEEAAEMKAAEEIYNKLDEKEKRAIDKCGAQIYIRHETRENWPGFIPFFIFRCGNENCGKIAKDYPHGFSERRYLICHKCGTRQSFDAEVPASA